MSGRIAAFLHRDGTIIRDANYVRDPNDVVLLRGAASAIKRLNDADVAVVMITNQSGIARKFLTRADYNKVHARLEELLAKEGAHLLATFMCPHYPSIDGECDCRKPGLGMYRSAIAEYGIDPTRSLFTGDRYRDVSPGVALGGRAILLDVDSTPKEDRDRANRESIETATSLTDAVEQFLSALPA